MHGAHEVPGPDETLFVRVVKAGSLKVAAAQIGADPSTVSRRLGALEARLGVRLLQRSTRGSLPTEAGARYFDGLCHLVDQLDALEAEVCGSTQMPTGRLRVTAPVDFGVRFVVPVVQDLMRDAPLLEVEVVLGSGFFDVVGEAIDVAIRVGRLPDSSLVAKRLGVVPRVLVGGPSYLAARGSPRRPEDLAEHDFILYTAAGPPRPQIELTGAAGSEIVDIRGRITVNSVSAIRELVTSGMGLHLGPAWAFRDAIADGRVEVVLPEYGLPAYPLHALFAASAYVPAKIRVFNERMADYLRNRL